MFFLPLEVETKNLASPAEETITFSSMDVGVKQATLRTTGANKDIVQPRKLICEQLLWVVKPNITISSTALSCRRVLEAKSSFRKMVKEDTAAVQLTSSFSFFPFFKELRCLLPWFLVGWFSVQPGRGLLDNFFPWFPQTIDPAHLQSKNFLHLRFCASVCLFGYIALVVSSGCPRNFPVIRCFFSLACACISPLRFVIDNRVPVLSYIVVKVHTYPPSDYSLANYRVSTLKKAFGLNVKKTFACLILDCASQTIWFDRKDLVLRN